MTSWRKVAGGVAAGVAALAVVAVAVGACSPRPEDEAQRAAQAGQPGKARSALSAFLAGRFAQAGGDTKAAAEYFTAALRHDPDNVELMQRAFTLLVAEGRIADATPLAERLLAFDSDAAFPLLVVGIKEARAGRFAEAESRFAALPKRGVNTFLVPLLTAWSRAAAGKTDSAMEALAKLDETKGLDALKAYHSGLINDIADRPDAAGKAYEVALGSQLSIRSIEAAGSFYQRRGEPQRAQALYRRYEEEHPGTMLFDGERMLKAGPAIARSVGDPVAGMAEALFDVASLMRQNNAGDLSLLFARLALSVKPDFPLAQVMVADVLASQDRLAEANVLYRALSPESPAHAYGRLRAAMNLDEMGRTDAALAELDELAKAHPDEIDALVTKGDVLRRKKRFAEAAQAYDAALARVGQPEARHWPLVYSRGIAYERSKQWPKAEADFLKALALKPDQPDVLNYLGYTWVDMGMNLEKGRTMLEKAVEQRPRDGAIVDSLGWALYRLGDFQGAVKQLERAVELKPEDPTVNDHLGDAYFQVGRDAEAMVQWKRALSLDPEPEQIEPLKEKIRTGQVPAKPLAK